MWLYFLRIYYICFHMSNENPEMVRERKAKQLEGTGRTTQTRTYGGRRCENAHRGQVGIRVRGRGAGVGRGRWEGWVTASWSLTIVVCCHGNTTLKDWRLLLSTTLDHMFSRQQNASRTHGGQPWGLGGVPGILSPRQATLAVPLHYLPPSMPTPFTPKSCPGCSVPCDTVLSARSRIRKGGKFYWAAMM